MRLKEEGIRLDVFGKITYVDIYDDPQETEFRLMFGGEYAAISQGMMFCEDGNKAT